MFRYINQNSHNSYHCNNKLVINIVEKYYNNSYCTKTKKYNLINKNNISFITNNHNNINKINQNNNNNNNNNNNSNFKKTVYYEKQYDSYNKSWYEFDGFEKIPVTSTGIISLDYKLLIGGIPFNHITEIFGDTSTGKSTLAYSIISNFQNTNKDRVLYIDTENSFNLDWALKNGVNLSNCTVFQPNSSEETFSLIKNSINSQYFKLIILDSISSLMPINDLNTSLETTVLSNGTNLDWLFTNLQDISSIIRNSNCCLIFTNQLRYKFINKTNNDQDIQDNGNSDDSINGIDKVQSELTSFANSTLNQFVDIALELKKDRFLINKDNKIIGIKTFIDIKKNMLFHHGQYSANIKDQQKSITNNLYKKKLNSFQPFLDINFEKGIQKENEILKLANEILIPTTASTNNSNNIENNNINSSNNIDNIVKELKSKLFNK